jgi:hypothetical protein
MSKDPKLGTSADQKSFGPKDRPATPKPSSNQSAKEQQSQENSISVIPEVFSGHDWSGWVHGKQDNILWMEFSDSHMTACGIALIEIYSDGSICLVGMDDEEFSFNVSNMKHAKKIADALIDGIAYRGSEA